MGAVFGTMCVGALADGREYSAALELCGTAAAADQPDWIATIFRRWGECDPTAAVAACDALSVSWREPAQRALVAGWVEHDPAGLADYARRLEEGPMRDHALAVALFKWAERDPVALAQWLRGLPPGREFDAGATALVTVTDGANRSAEEARRWADAIGDAELRRAAIERVLAERSASANDSPTEPKRSGE